MQVALTDPKPRGVFQLTAALSAHESVHRLLFRKSHWNAIVREGLLAAGGQWIAEALPLRFTRYAIEALDYPETTGQQRSPLTRALASGLVDRMAERYWHGYNPWRQTSHTIPGALWKQWIEQERRAGRFEKSRSGYFRTARRELRREVKRDLLRRVRELSTTDEVNEKLPLVLRGDLRRAALPGARAVAVATSANAKLRLVIPQPHPTHPVVSRTLRRVTDAELGTMAGTLHATIERRMADGSVVTTPTGGRALTPTARAHLASLVKSRRAPRHRSRTVTV